MGCPTDCGQHGRCWPSATNGSAGSAAAPACECECGWEGGLGWELGWGRIGDSPQAPIPYPSPCLIPYRQNDGLLPPSSQLSGALLTAGASLPDACSIGHTRRPQAPPVTCRASIAHASLASWDFSPPAQLLQPPHPPPPRPSRCPAQQPVRRSQHVSGLRAACLHVVRSLPHPTHAQTRTRVQTQPHTTTITRHA